MIAVVYHEIREIEQRPASPSDLDAFEPVGDIGSGFEHFWGEQYVSIGGVRPVRQQRFQVLPKTL